MFAVATAMSQALSAETAAEELAVAVERQLGGACEVSAAMIFATAATGAGGCEIGQLLAARWPDSELFGTSFEGIVAHGRAIRDEPAVGVIAFGDHEAAPVPLVLPPGIFSTPPDAAEIHALAHTLVEAAGGAGPGPEDLLLLFPDSLASASVEPILESLWRELGGLVIAGAAASGPSGASCLAWSGAAPEAGATVGLFVPGGAGVGERSLRCASASRFASPWLEIGDCRTRWVDELEGESPVDWVRRQLGLEAGTSIAPYLDRLLVRLRVDTSPEIAQEDLDEDAHDFVERYVIGFDDRRGSISVPGDFARGGHLAFALPDSDRARMVLRRAVEELRPSSMLLQFACRARDSALHGDADIETAVVASAAGERRAVGTVGPFQLAPDAEGRCRLLVHTTVLAALGER